MKRVSRLSALFFIALLTLINCTPQSPIDVSDEIQLRNDQLVEAFTSQNFEMLKELYTENAVFMPQNAEAIQGSEGIQEVWKGMMNMGLTKVVLNTVEAKSYGLIAAEEGRYEMYIEDQKIDFGKYIVIWEKVGDDWKIAKDIVNSSVVPPPPPAPEEVEEME